jgi:hypothetical protein
MKILLTSILFFFTLSTCVAQKWIPAYIITARGDTSHGEIKFNKKMIFNQVIFKTEEGGIREFNPEQLRGYSFANRIFTRDAKVGNLVFIEKKIDGPVSLFETNLFVNQHGTVPPTRYKVNYFVRRGNEDYIAITNRDFVQNMSELVKDNEELHKLIINKKLKYKDLAEVVTRYNAWYSANNN